MNYQEAITTLNNRESKKIDNNTYLIKLEDQRIGIKLHETIIITIDKNNTKTYDNGSWQTKTTKERINKYADLHVTQKNGLWYMDNSLFFNGIKTKGNKVLNPQKPDNKEKKKRKLDKMVSTYIKGFTENIDNLGLPSNGDCWGCLFKDETKLEPMGYSHYLKHIKEKYFVPSLVVKAAKTCGCGDYYLHAIFTLKDKEILKRLLISFFKKIKSNLLEIF